MTSVRSIDKKVLIADPVHPDAVKRLTDAGFSVTELPEDDRHRLLHIVAPFHALICRTSTTCDVALYEKATNLEVISIASTGLDRIHVQEAKKRSIAVFGLPSFNPNIDPEREGNFVSTAEHTMLLILAVLGNFHNAYVSMKEGRWDKSLLVGNELANKTIGLLGFGRIATLVARRLKAFRSRIISYDLFPDHEKANAEGVELVSFETFCKEVDLISIHTPRTPESEGILNKAAFAMMKNGVFIVNTARASLINEPDLIEALNSGKVKRVALDVFHDEPSGVHQGLSRELLQMPCVIATPHIGGSTHEAWRRISLSAADNLIAYMNGETINNRVV